MTITVPMNAPAGVGGSIGPCESGTVYNVPTSGVVLVQLADVPLFLRLGFTSAYTAASVGTPAAGVTAVEFGDAHRHCSVLTLAGTLPAIAGGAALGIGLLLYTLPAGAQLIKSAYISAAIKQTQGHITADTPTVGLGTVIASGAVSVLSGTATFQNLMAGVAAADCNGTPTVQATKATSSPFEFVTLAAGAKTIYFNAANTWAASGDAAALLTGTVIINWDHFQ